MPARLLGRVRRRAPCSAQGVTYWDGCLDLRPIRMSCAAASQPAKTLQEGCGLQSRGIARWLIWAQSQLCHRWLQAVSPRTRYGRCSLLATLLSGNGTLASSRNTWRRPRALFAKWSRRPDGPRRRSCSRNGESSMSGAGRLLLGSFRRRGVRIASLGRAVHRRCVSNRRT